MAEIDCLRDCEGFCCESLPGGTIMMELTNEEVLSLQQKGTRLLMLVEPEEHDREEAPCPLNIEADMSMVGYGVPLDAHYGRYALIGACGNLTQTSQGFVCGDYKNRPKVCKEFEAGGNKCRELRTIHRAGSTLSIPIDLTKKPK